MNIPWNIYRTHSSPCYYTYRASNTDIVLPFLPVMTRDSLAAERQDVVVRACGRRATLQACQGRLWRLEDEGIHDKFEHRMDLPSISCDVYDIVQEVVHVGRRGVV
jgi:hypothetical protein